MDVLLEILTVAKSYESTFTQVSNKVKPILYFILSNLCTEQEPKNSGNMF